MEKLAALRGLPWARSDYTGRPDSGGEDEEEEEAGTAAPFVSRGRPPKAAAKGAARAKKVPSRGPLKAVFKRMKVRPQPPARAKREEADERQEAAQAAASTSAASTATQVRSSSSSRRARVHGHALCRWTYGAQTLSRAGF